MTAGMVRVTNLTPGSANPARGWTCQRSTRSRMPRSKTQVRAYVRGSAGAAREDACPVRAVVFGESGGEGCGFWGGGQLLILYFGFAPKNQNAKNQPCWKLFGRTVADAEQQTT
jgi:hypothetical protein